MPAIATKCQGESTLRSLTFGSNGVSGDVYWIKDGLAGGPLNPEGLTNQMTVLGSRYVAPPTGTRVLPLNAGLGRLDLTGGNLSSGLWSAAVLSTLNKFTFDTSPLNLTLTLTPSSGLLKGSFNHPGNGFQLTPLNGVVLQNTNSASGNFKGVDKAGTFRIQAHPAFRHRHPRRCGADHRAGDGAGPLGEGRGDREKQARAEEREPRHERVARCFHGADAGRAGDGRPPESLMCLGKKTNRIRTSLSKLFPVESPAGQSSSIRPTSIPCDPRARCGG